MAATTLIVRPDIPITSPFLLFFLAVYIPMHPKIIPGIATKKEKLLMMGMNEVTSATIPMTSDVTAIPETGALSSPCSLFFWFSEGGSGEGTGACWIGWGAKRGDC